MPNVQSDSVLAKKLNAFLTLSQDELKCLADLQGHPLNVRRGEQLTREGQTEHKAFVLQTGWACSFKTLPDGARQIISFPIAGDIVGLRSILLRTADHSFSALTDAVVHPLQGTHIMRCVTEYNNHSCLARELQGEIATQPCHGFSSAAEFCKRSVA